MMFAFVFSQEMREESPGCVPYPAHIESNKGNTSCLVHPKEPSMTKPISASVPVLYTPLTNMPSRSEAEAQREFERSADWMNAGVGMKVHKKGGHRRKHRSGSSNSSSSRRSDILDELLVASSESSAESSVEEDSQNASSSSNSSSSNSNSIEDSSSSSLVSGSFYYKRKA